MTVTSAMLFHVIVFRTTDSTSTCRAETECWVAMSSYLVIHVVDTQIVIDRAADFVVDIEMKV